MDLEILFWLVFILAPVLSRLFRGKKAPRPAPPSEFPTETAEREPVAEKQLSPFEEALRQIQDALVEARESQESDQEEAERLAFPAPARPAPVRPPVPAPMSPPPPPRQVHEQAAREFRTGEKFYDENFETKPYEVAKEEFHETVHAHVPASDDSDYTVDPQERRARHFDRRKWKQAVVMGEILSEPRSKRRWNLRDTRT